MRMRRTVIAACSLAFVATLGFGAARAGNPPVSPAAQSSTSSASPILAKADTRAAANRTQVSQSHTKQAKDPPAAKVAKAPSNFTCLRTTGSMFTPRPGQCNNVFGNTYTQDDLWRTGTTTAFGALRTLDPSVTLVH